jgi:hypothetical protein
MLTVNQIESELSIAYVQAVSAHAGFATEFKRIDMDSVDVSIEAKGLLTANSILHSPKVDIQLKASINCNMENGDTIPFPLSIKNYNDLRAKTLVPRILVVLCLPPDRDNWLTHSLDDLILRRCAYWVSLLGEPEISNTATRTVQVPKINTFTQASIHSILGKISELQSL